MSPSDESWQSFQRILNDADELLRLRGRLADLVLRRPLASFDGFSELLDAALPTDAPSEARLARAVALPVEVLRRLRVGAVNPSALPADALTRLGRGLHLDTAQFFALVGCDTNRFAQRNTGMQTRDASGGERLSPDEALHGLRAAWERAALDDPRAATDEEA